MGATAYKKVVDFRGITELAGDPASREQIDRLFRRYYWAAEYCTGRDVLEVACGAGQGLGYLASVASSLIAADVSEAVLAGTRKHYGDRIAISCFAAEAMPLANASRDVIIMFEAIYYVTDASQFVREAHRVLRPGGVLLLASANKDLFDFTPSPFSVRYFGANELASLLNAGGFDVALFGDTDVTEVSSRQRLLRPLKRLATALHLMPSNKRLKAMLKRLVFGPIASIPAEVAPGYQVAGLPLAVVPAGEPDARHKVLYAVARRRA